jgi:hypothetical protein
VRKPLTNDAVSADEEIRNPLVLEFLGLKDEYGATGSPWSAANRALVTAGQKGLT